jgi:hypothetical protein
MSYDKPSILLAELWERQSAKGNQYFSGFMGGLSLVLLRDGERPHPTRPDEVVTVWKLVAQERDRPATPRQSPPTPGRQTAPSSMAERPSVFRREGARARQERVSAEIAAGHGVRADEDLNDEIGF